MHRDKNYVLVQDSCICTDDPEVSWTGIETEICRLRSAVIYEKIMIF